ncbi:MAG TPA: preprotein translocase subunit SecE [Anaerolineaceae bacterium]|nr:preprotein translocase subunit SecE [Anaerolineaceae bacterium]HPN52710.1 preprotein translocase subunit SecE [Anaerolineaceae bacterium]
MAETESKPNFFQRMGQGIQQYVRETSGELRKVKWPTTQEAWSLTRIVLIVLVVMSVLLGTLDGIFSTIMSLLVTI